MYGEYLGLCDGETRRWGDGVIGTRMKPIRLIEMRMMADFFLPQRHKEHTKNTKFFETQIEVV